MSLLQVPHHQLWHRQDDVDRFLNCGHKFTKEKTETANSMQVKLNQGDVLLPTTAKARGTIPRRAVKSLSAVTILCALIGLPVQRLPNQSPVASDTHDSFVSG